MPIHGNSCTVTTHVHVAMCTCTQQYTVLPGLRIYPEFTDHRWCIYSLVLGGNKGALGDNNKCTLMHGFWIFVRTNGYENRDGKCIGSPQIGRMHSCCDDFNRDRDCGRFDRACNSYFVFCLRTLRNERGDYDCQGNYRNTIVTSVNVNMDL